MKPVRRKQMTPFYLDSTVQLYHSDALETLKLLPEASADSLCTDPPAGISFMSKSWDTFKGDTRQADEVADSNAGQFKRSKVTGYGNKSPREWFVSSLTPIFCESLRVLKPGAYGLVWAIPRTSHWTAWVLEDAGFEIRDRITHIFGSGFPKSLNIQRAIDSHLCQLPGRHYWDEKLLPESDKAKTDDHVCPFTPEGQVYEGWGSALKPGVEDWWLVRKPLAGTTAANALEHGTGGLNVDACRVGYASDADRALAQDNALGPVERSKTTKAIYEGGKQNGGFKDTHSPLGRWPSHLVLSHSADCELVGTKQIKAISGGGGVKTTGTMTYGDFQGREYEGTLGYGNEDGRETIENWHCAADCPVRLLDAQSGDRKAGGNLSGSEPSRPGRVTYGNFDDGRPKFNSYSDVGGASRFYYCAKASVEDREEGLEDLIAFARDESRKEGNPGGDNLRNRGLKLRKNHHPTVKATDLMRWLIRLITPPGGTVLDPFAGSGSTGKAAALEGCKAILIEQELPYCEIAARRARLRQPKLGF